MEKLQIAETYLQKTIAPIANQIDEQVEALRSALAGLGDRQLLALRVPESWGGGLSDEQFHRFQELTARYSGALAFLQTQHQSAAAMLVKSENESLKQAFLPHMGSGEKRVGIGFSHLRRATNPPLKAVPVNGGYRLHGHIPWITGFDFFQSVLIAAVLPNGEALYGMVPFTNQFSNGEIRFSAPMALAAMTSTNTVTANLTEWFLPASQVAFVLPATAIHNSDRASVLNHSFFALGCAQAGLDVLKTVSRSKSSQSSSSTLKTLTEELDACRSAIYSAQTASFETRLKLRASSIELMMQCAHAAVIASSGAAISKSHPAQRVFREALLFSVSGQTHAVLEASLDRYGSTRESLVIGAKHQSASV